MFNMSPQDEIFADMVRDRFSTLESKVDKLNDKVDNLTKWKIQVTTVAVVISTIISCLFKFLIP